MGKHVGQAIDDAAAERIQAGKVAEPR